MLKLSRSVVSNSLRPLWTVDHQTPPSMGSSRQEYWNGLPFPSPGDLHNPGVEPRSPALQADPLTSEPPGIHLRSKFTQNINDHFLSRLQNHEITI